MIQELLGGGTTLVRERKISINGFLEGSPSPSPSSSSANITATAATTTATTTATSSPSSTSSQSSDQQNLRCPRCDSSNTKFCYYNNYNLTQPRHFCKTCRRYWTKGGALRNVPKGGGCRKNKNTASLLCSAGKSMKTASEIVKANIESSFHQEPNSNPILWASPHNSQLLSLLRASHNLNPNPNPSPNPMCSSVTVKDERATMGSHMTSDHQSAEATGALNARTLMSLDPLSQIPIGLCSSFWRNNQHHQPQQQGLLHGEVENTGVQELYQRLRSSGNYYTGLTNVASTSSSSGILEPAAGQLGNLGYWNPGFSWSDLPTTNGAFP